MKRLKVGGYVRVSTEEQASLVDGSLDNQQYRIRAFVDLKNVQEPNWGSIVEVYIDDGYSAKDTRRPAFQRMMADIKKGKIDLILATDLSRLSRNIPDFCGILEVLKQNEASFLSIKEQFDTSTPSGKMMVYNMINLAQFEREQTAERVALGCHARAMRGLLNGGQEVLGFSKINEKKNTYVVNEAEADTVRTIFKLFLESGSLSRTVKKLEEMAITPKLRSNRRNKIVDRGLWTTSTLRDLLKNYAYIGMREVNKKNKNSDSNFLKGHERYQLVKASWPGIVDKEIFKLVQKLLTENRTLERRRLAGGERRVFLVSGVVRCKECGRSMVGQSSHGHMSVHRYYKHAYSKGDVVRCSVNRIRAEEIEEAVSSHLFTMLQQGNYLDGVAERIVSEEQKNIGGSKMAKTRLEKELRDTEIEMESAFKFQIKTDAGSSAAEFFLKKIEDLGIKKNELKQRIESMKETADNVISLEEVRRNLEDRVQAVSRGWKKLSDGQKKRTLRRLVKQILVSSEGLDISYFYNSLADERSLGGFTVETESLAKVLPFHSKGTKILSSKSQSENCLLSGMVMLARLERATYCLEGNCSIQLSYSTMDEKRNHDFYRNPP